MTRARLKSAFLKTALPFIAGFALCAFLNVDGGYDESSARLREMRLSNLEKRIAKGRRKKEALRASDEALAALGSKSDRTAGELEKRADAVSANRRELVARMKNMEKQDIENEVSMAQTGGDDAHLVMRLNALLAGG